MSVQSLSDERLKYYEDILLKEKAETLKIINDIDELQKRGSKESNGNLSSYSIHQADHGSDTDYQEKQAYLLEKEMNKLKSLNAALSRIYDKSYGICQICGEYIPDARLKIVPYAKLCIKCKSIEESKEKNRMK